MSIARVGIFYLLDGKEIVLDSTPLNRAEDHGSDFLIHARDHQSFWDKEIVCKHTCIRLHSYDYYPRGRVVYRIKDGMFLFYKDKCVGPESVDQISRKLNLPPEMTLTFSDSHYKCNVCNKRYISDAIGLEF